jgi:hypothetical protein
LDTSSTRAAGQAWFGHGRLRLPGIEEPRVGGGHLRVALVGAHRLDERRGYIVHLEGRGFLHVLHMHDATAAEGPGSVDHQLGFLEGRGGERGDGTGARGQGRDLGVNREVGHNLRCHTRGQSRDSHTSTTG